MSNIIALLFAIELGWMPTNAWYDFNAGGWDAPNGAYYLNIDAEVVILDHFFIGSVVETSMKKSADQSIVSPLQQMYQLRTGVKFKNLEIGYSHMYGPVSVMDAMTFGLSENSSLFEAGKDRIYIKMSNH